MALYFAPRQLRLWIVTLLHFVFACLILAETAPSCEVLVSGRSWPTPRLRVPQNSTVLFSCSLNDSLAYWTIDLASDGIDSQLQFVESGGQRSLLNANGVYELESVETATAPTLRLLVNDSTENNQTKIFCFGSLGNVNQLVTTLILYDPSLLSIDVEVMPSDKEESVIVSWNPIPTSLDSDTNLTYELSIVSPNTKEVTVHLQEPRFLFSAQENAPACEVYNFSVTATYVGATYTGAGCSEPSPVISRMLPSLPDIEALESSLNHTLKKESGKLFLIVSFQPANCCVEYPVANYTLEVEGVVSAGSPGTPQFTSELAGENTLRAEDIPQNEVYQFKVSAENSVGQVSTKNVEIYTTDVQSVRVAETHRADSVTIQCRFVSGSDAEGCMVVLVGELSNTTVSMTRKGSDRESLIVHTLMLPLSCYHLVFALDIEADGSVGTLPVPGVLERDSNTRVKCSPTKEQPLQGGSSQWILPVVVSTLLIVLAAVIIVVIAIIILQARIRHSVISSRNVLLSDSSSDQKSFSEDDKNFPVYAIPMKPKKHTNGVRSCGDGAENETIHQESSTAAIELVTNNGMSDVNLVGVTLCESKQLDCSQGNVRATDEAEPPALPPPFNPDATTPPPPPPPPQPVYQEIPFSTRTRSPPSVPNNDPKPELPIYQDILELSSTRDRSTNASSLQIERHDGQNPTHQPAPLPVYQEITDVTASTTPARFEGSGGNSFEVDNPSTMETDSATTTPETVNSALATNYNLELAPDCQTIDRTGNLAPIVDHSELHGHPSTLPIYQDISESNVSKPNGNAVNGLESSNTVPSALAPASHTDPSPYTPESRPTPIYEDIAEATGQGRTTPHTSSEVGTPSQLPPPLPGRAAADNNILVVPSQNAFTTPPPLPQRGAKFGGSEALSATVNGTVNQPHENHTAPPPLPERGTKVVSRDAPHPILVPPHTDSTLTDSSVEPQCQQLDSSSPSSLLQNDSNFASGELACLVTAPHFPDRAATGGSVEPPPPPPPLNHPNLPLVQTLVHQNAARGVDHETGQDSSNPPVTSGTLV